MPAAGRRRDGLADALTAERRASREKDARIEELEGMVAKLTAQVNRDFENSSMPSSAQGPGRKRVPNTREATGRRPGAQPGHPHHPRRGPEPTATVELHAPFPGGAKDEVAYDGSVKALAFMLTTECCASIPKPAMAPQAALPRGAG